MGLWVSVVEIQHNRPTMDREAGLSGIPPSVRVAPCTEMPCQRCDQRRGGFHFPFVGHCTSADAVVPDTMSQRPGAIIMSTLGRPWWMQKSTSSGVACTQKMVCRSRRTGLFRPLCAKSIPRRPLPNISGAHGVNGTLGAGLGWSQAGHLPRRRPLEWIAQPVRAECLGPSRQEAGLKSGSYVFLSGRDAGRRVTPSALVMVLLLMVLGAKQWKEPPRRVLGTCRQQTPFSIAWQKTARASSEIPTSCRMTATLRMHLLPGRKPFWQEERQWPTHSCGYRRL